MLFWRKKNYLHFILPHLTSERLYFVMIRSIFVDDDRQKRSSALTHLLQPLPFTIRGMPLIVGNLRRKKCNLDHEDDGLTNPILFLERMGNKADDSSLSLSLAHTPTRLKKSPSCELLTFLSHSGIFSRNMLLRSAWEGFIRQLKSNLMKTNDRQTRASERTGKEEPEKAVIISGASDGGRGAK